MEIYLIGSLVALILALCYVFFQWYSGQDVTGSDIGTIIFCVTTSWVGVILMCAFIIINIYEILTPFWRKVIIKGKNKN